MNPVIKSNTVRSLFVSLFLLFTFGCATSTPNSVVAGSSHNLPYGMKTIDDSFWWRCQFRMVWPNDVEPDWAVDLLIAHAVVSPVLLQYEEDIPYWRFHRRAARDGAGHQFSFIFYSKSETASSVFDAFNKSEVLKNIVKAKIVGKVILGDPNNPKLPSISDTSDSSWSPEVQKYWPSYIMGVSSLWLGLIIEDMQHNRESIEDVNRLLEEYRLVDTNLAGKWRKEGQHALLHHLSAIFGYQPMLITKEVTF